MANSTPATKIEAQAPPEFVSQRRILLFWLPLAASWLLMSTEMPFVNAVLARLTEAERMIAAFGIVGSLSITIESPVIMLLATTTALARTRQNYLMLRRFTGHLMLGTTLLHWLIGWTPLFYVVVRDWMGVPTTLLEPIRIGMRLMVFWSAAIAWRRFKQGILIRYGQTRFVGQGTVIRLLSSAGTAVVLALVGRVPGVAVGAYALSIGVIIEAGYAHWVAQKIIADKLGARVTPPGHPDLGYRELVKFHAPLAASTLLFLLIQPLISAALSRMRNPEVVLAAWPVAAGVLFITRSPTLALPEVIIALIDERGSLRPLRKFSLRIGLACLGVLSLVGFTPLAHFYFRILIGVPEDLAALSIAGAQLGLLLPFIMASNSWFRGLLTAHRATLPLTLAMTVNLLTMALALTMGVSLQAPGVPMAALAMTLSIGAETLVLWMSVRRRRLGFAAA